MYSLLSIKNGVCASEGFFSDSANAGLRGTTQDDNAFIYSDTLCDVASVFTTNKMTAAPIKHFLNYGEFQTNFIYMNAKNANAMTAQKGIDDIDDILNAIKEKFPNIHNPIMSSTGVIGVRLPKKALIQSALTFDLSKKNSTASAKAIMTTDTYHKEIAFKVILENGKSFSIGGIAKGAGMINPSMATMLCFITTDANIDKEELQTTLNQEIKTTFNAISVDGDTSTNDTVLILSNKRSGAYNKTAFRDALHKVMEHLSLEIVQDGEGAKKLVAFEVSGAKNNAEAELCAKKLSNSLLVKTAIFGEDPNWGRIASTIGASGVMSDELKLIVAYDDVVVYDRGENLFTSEIEEKAFKIMKKDSFNIKCNLGMGDGYFKAYGCDLGYEYVKINADYRT